MYAGVPPLTTTVAVPVALPKQLAGADVAVAVNAVGSVTVVVAVAVQLFASLTVTVYVPAARLFAVAVIWPFDHT